jgi:discoidin domain receptor family protein 2
MSYDMPQGDQRGDMDLSDKMYDGEVIDRQLVGGLGQLTDGEKGDSNFRQEHSVLGRKGYSWIGWKNDSRAGRPIELRFVMLILIVYCDKLN